MISVDSDGASLLTDWAWLLVREGRVLDVIVKSPRFSKCQSLILHSCSFMGPKYI